MDRIPDLRQNPPVSDSPVSYTTIEIQSYLPSGWVLIVGGAEPQRRGSAWAARVVDIADTEWSLEIASREVDRHGRLVALQREIDRVYREALG